MERVNFHSLLNYHPAEPARTPLAVSGRELVELISPTPCEDFATRYFSAVPLSVPGTPRKFERIFSWEALSKALKAGQAVQDQRYVIRASFTRGEAWSSQRMIPAYYGQLAELLQAGATVCITNIHLADSYLNEWAGAIRSQIKFTGNVGVNCYISPDGFGFPMHYDARIATTLQIAGTKRWIFSTETAKRWPAHNALYRQGRVESTGEELGNPGKSPTQMEFQEVELNPGDLLSLPAGAWHSTRAVGYSLAINLYFEPRNFLDDLIPILQDFAGSNSNWISGPPVIAETSDGSIPETVSAYIRKRLDELNKATQELAEDPSVLTESWMNSFRPTTDENT